MSIEDWLLKKSEHNKYMQTIGILNAYEPTIFVSSQEPSIIRLSCIQLWRHCCASNLKNVGKQTFQETSAHRIFIESCNIHLLKNSLHFKSLQKFINMLPLSRSAMFQRCIFAWSNVKCSGSISFTERNIERAVKYQRILFPNSDICSILCPFKKLAYV